MTGCHLCRCFQSVLVHLQLLWELLLLGEPLVVMAPSPTASSETVLALVRYQSHLWLITPRPPPNTGISQSVSNVFFQLHLSAEVLL